MFRVGLVGCGRVAEHHLKFLVRVDEVQVVGIADINREAAREVADRFGVQAVFGSLEELLEAAQPDVVHITTPPALHFSQTKLSLESGAHVFLEKPVGIHPTESVQLQKLASDRGLTVCADFIQLFHPRMQQAIELVKSGQFGKVIRCEAHLGLDLDSPDVEEAKGLHWSYNLPGGILHNSITHPLYLIMYWTGGPRQITTYHRALGTIPQELTDHIEVLVEGEHATGFLVISSSCRPHEYSTRIICERGAVTVDFNTQAVLVERESGLPRMISRGLGNYCRALSLVSQATGNIIDLIRGRLVSYHGLDLLVRRFYAFLGGSGQLPVPMELAVNVTEAETEILRNAGKVHLDLSDIPARLSPRRQERILVTGAAGYVGMEITRQLVEAGYFVRVFVRPATHLGPLKELGVEIFLGDIRDREQVLRATADIDIVVHAAAGLRGSRSFMMETCVQGTRNIADAAQEQGVRRVIYLSSQSIYDFSATAGGRLTEESPLESKPELRGAATAAKVAAEAISVQQLSQGVPAWTIIRPSVIFGNGRDLSSLLGTRRGRLVIGLGTAGRPLRVIHVKDVAGAVMTILERQNTMGKVYNISHTEMITAGEIAAALKRRVGSLRFLFVPAWVATIGAISLNLVQHLRGKGPLMNRKRLTYLFSEASVSTEVFIKDTGWTPAEPLSEQISRAVAE